MRTTRSLRNVVPASSLPITVAEFAHALARIWTLQPGIYTSNAPPIGLAISGGVDSMALAFLCSELKDSKLHRLARDEQTANKLKSLEAAKFQAFVVDHGVREGSDKEAEHVSEILQSRDIPTQILKLKWPEPPKSLISYSFETKARTLRFRALGRACLDLKIDSLLLAHHLDDQAETVMTRIALGRRSGGLAGIKAIGNIPECKGMYGVHESGLPIFDYDSETGISSTEINGDGESHIHPRLSGSRRKRTLLTENQVPLESGGIQLYRPFLSWPKDRLRATCQTNQMPWVEDLTNADPTLTARNAVRRLFSSYKLPQALQPPSLINLSQTITKKYELEDQVAKSWLSQCLISDFETRTGLLKIKFPDLIALATQTKIQHPELNISHIAANLIRRVIQPITPKETIQLDSLHNTISFLFPELAPSFNPLNNDNPIPLRRFTSAGILFDPQVPKLVSSYYHPKKPFWHLSRQPYSFAETSKFPIPIPKTYSYTVPTTPSVSLNAAANKKSGSSSTSVLKEKWEQEWTPWTLYDSRIWIRLSHNFPTPLHLTPFTPSLLGSLHPLHSYTLKNHLNHLAPSLLRFTLPAIVFSPSPSPSPLSSHEPKSETENENEKGKGKGKGGDVLLGLPSLGINGRGEEEGGMEWKGWEVRWEVRWKKVDLDGFPRELVEGVKGGKGLGKIRGELKDMIEGSHKKGER